MEWVLNHLNLWMRAVDSGGRLIADDVARVAESFTAGT